jgi:hypothetical protein
MKQNPQKTSVSDCKQRTLDYLSRLINNRYKMKINETKRGVIYHYLSLFITLIINNKYIYINNLHGYLSDSIPHYPNFMVLLKIKASISRYIQHQTSNEKPFLCMKSYLRASDFKSDSHVSYIAVNKRIKKNQKRRLSRFETDSRHDNFRVFCNTLKTIGIQN